MTENGNGTEPGRISFGPRPDDDMPISWAETILTNWRESSPTAFGKALMRAAIERKGPR